MAAILAGLIPNPVEASETHIPSTSNSSSIERVVDTLRGGFKKEVIYRIKEDAGLARAAREACTNQNVQRDVNHLENELSKGNMNPGIGSKPICSGITEIRAANGGRLYVREIENVIEILAKSGKKKSNQDYVINRLKETYD